MPQADKMNFSTHFMLLCFQFTVKFMNNEIEITRHSPKHQQTFLHSSNINFIQFPTNVVLSVCIFYTGIHGPGLTVPGLGWCELDLVFKHQTASTLGQTNTSKIKLHIN